MPELPDVVTYKNYLDATALHQRIAKVDIRDADLLDGVSESTLRSQLKGAEFESTSTHGKYLFVRLNDGHGWLVLHFGMTGFLKYFQDETDAPDHTRLLLDFEGGYHLAYDCQRKLGRIGITGEKEEFIQDQNLGPDALSNDLDAERFREILEHRSATIKAALMNQHLIAGIGNVYSNEILFQSRIHPATKACDLDESDRRALLRSIRHVLKTAIDRNVVLESFPKSWLLSHLDGGCPRCGARLETARISGRTAHFCPQCQPK